MKLLTREEIQTKPGLGDDRERVLALFDALTQAQRRGEEYKLEADVHWSNFCERSGDAKRAQVARLREALTKLDTTNATTDDWYRERKPDPRQELIRATLADTSDAWLTDHDAKVRAAALEEAALLFEAEAVQAHTLVAPVSDAKIVEATMRAAATAIRTLAEGNGGKP